jgi:nuclease S1
MFLIILMAPNNVWSWSPPGHRIVARMTQQRLTAKAVAAVRDLLGQGLNIADVSTWADEEQGIAGSRRWHYVDVPIKEMRYDPKYCQPGGCIVSKIEDFKRALRDPGANKRQKQEALKFLIHFVADLHQPMHVGDNYDKGGNLLQIRFFNDASNLHKVWDHQIMARHSLNESVWLWDLDFLANPRMVGEWSKGTPEDWATETLQVAKEAYCLPGTRTVMKSGAKLGNDYYRFALPVIQKQLAKAGIRTAFILNEIFK